MGRILPFRYWRSGNGYRANDMSTARIEIHWRENDSVSAFGETAQIRLRLCQVTAPPLSHLAVCVTQETLYRFEGAEPLSCQASSHVASQHALKRLKQVFVSSRCLQGR